jgi:hypothetical protein
MRQVSGMQRRSGQGNPPGKSLLATASAAIRGITVKNSFRREVVICWGFESSTWYMNACCTRS